MKCTQCNSELKQIPAGISNRTGKPYDAFMACPNKCKQGVQGTQPAQQYVAPTRDFKAEAFGKCKHTFLVEEFKIKPDLENIDDREAICEEFAKRSMRVQPTEPQYVEPVSTTTATTAAQEEIKLTDIPF